MEHWKDINGFESIYQISDLGRVKALPKIIYYKNGKTQKRKERILKEQFGSTGYKFVILQDSGKRVTKYIHRLMAEAFIPNPDNKPYVDHINTIKGDNRLENLKWVTVFENMNNPLTLQHLRDKEQENFHSVKGIKGDEVIYFEALADAKRAGFHPNAIKMCIDGKISQHKGYKWFDDV